MSDTNGYDPDDDDGTPGDLVKDLRKQLNAANKALKQLRDAEKSKSIDKVLAKLPEGKREKAQKLIGDGDPEEWFEEYGDLFGGVEPKTTTQEDPLPPEAEVANEISAATSGSEPATRVDNLRSALRAAGTEQEAFAAFSAEIAKYGDARVTNY